ncbi:toll receptor 13, partial [Biomphalaria glabrata]
QDLQCEIDCVKMKLVFSSNFPFVILELCIRIHVLGGANTGTASLQETSKYQDKIPCTLTFRRLEVKADCQRQSLDYVSNVWFPKNITILLLNENLLTTLENTTFVGLSKLRILDISRNLISKIDIFAFVDLVSLEYLNLEWNRLNIYSHPEIDLCPLVNLTELRIKQQWLEGKIQSQRHASSNASKPTGYPKLLGCLTNLRILNLDTLGDTLYFDDFFSNLTKLTYLGIQGGVNQVTNSSFENVKTVKSLYWSACDVAKFDDMAFGAFEHLETLFLDHVAVGFHRALQLLKPLVNTNMTSIVLYEVIINYYDKSLGITTGDGLLTKNDTIYLTSICVKQVIIYRNNIFVIETGALSSEVWDRCLKFLDLSETSLLSKREILRDVFMMRSIEFVILTGDWLEKHYYSSFVDNIASDKEYGSLLLSHLKDKQGSFIKSQYNKKHPQKFNVKEGADVLYNWIVKNIFLDDSTIITLRISESIKYIDLNWYFNSVNFKRNIHFMNASNVQYIDFSFNNGYNFIGNISGFTGVKTLILSGNNLNVLSTIFFDGFSSLELLELSQCNFDSTFITMHSQRLFQSLVNLTSLDLSNNLLSFLPRKIFLTNTKLRWLNLEGNRFISVPFDLRITPEIEWLSLRTNSIVSLDKGTMMALDAQTRILGKLYLFLDGNVLSCACPSLVFLKWLMNTSVTLDKNGNFTCLDRNYLVSYVFKFKDIGDFWRQCVGQDFFYAALVIYGVFTIVLLVALIYARKWRAVMSGVYHLLYGFKLHTSQDYSMVFIICPDPNISDLLKRSLSRCIRGLPVHIHGADDVAGENVLMSICDNIASSWRIICVVSDQFFQEEFLRFAISTALIAHSPANPGQLIYLVQESLYDQVPQEWLAAVEEENIMVVPSWNLSYNLIQTLKMRIRG